MTTVSVLMTVYSEPQEWIITAVNSILNQTFTDFEFIIINDNPSREDLNKLLESNNDSRIKYYINKENIGLTKTLNIGLKLCTGKYIARMDADDWSYPDRLRKQVEFMESNPELIASSALAYSWDGDNSLTPIYRPTDYNDIIPYTFSSSPFIHPLLIIRREILVSNNITYDEYFTRSQDYKLAVDLLKYGRIANSPDYLLKYRISEQQITSKYGHEQVELCKHIRRQYINNFYQIFDFGILDESITIDTIKRNKELEAQCIAKLKESGGNMRILKQSMNSIRRLFYYSLESYNINSLFNFIFSGDYFKFPYNLRRFGVVITKHFKSEFIPKLL